MPVTCVKYGTNAEYGDGTLYCRLVGTIPWIVRFNEDFIGGFTSSWNLQSPDGTIWTPSIDTDGTNLKFTSGVGTASTVPVFQDDDLTTVWAPSISNTGVITLTSRAKVDADQIAVIEDVDGVGWILQVNANNIAIAATNLIVGDVALKPLHKVSLSIKQTGQNFYIAGVWGNVKRSQDTADLFTAEADLVTQTRVSLSIKHAGSNIELSGLQGRINKKKHLPKD